jgi:signal transduction histidine kinase
MKTIRPAPNALAAVLLLAAVGWGACVYSAISARAQQRAYQDEISRVTADRDKLSTDLNQARVNIERNGLTLERVQAELVSARAQLQASPPQTSRDEMRRVVADRDKLNAELNQQRAEAERNRLARERAQAELASARAQSQTSSASPAPPVRARPVR